MQVTVRVVKEQRPDSLDGMLLSQPNYVETFHYFLWISLRYIVGGRQLGITDQEGIYLVQLDNMEEHLLQWQSVRL